MTPELWPLWCGAIAVSFSSTAIRGEGRAWSRAIAGRSPSSPAPRTTTSSGLSARPAGSSSNGMAGPFHDPVPQHPEAFDFEFDHVAWAQPSAVVVFEDAAGPDRPRPDDVSGPERGVLGGPRDHRLPSAVQVGQVPAGAF